MKQPYELNSSGNILKSDNMKTNMKRSCYYTKKVIQSSE